MKKVLILGHKGFLGSALWGYLEKKNVSLHFTNHGSLENLIKNDFEIIVNCAGKSDFLSCEMGEIEAFNSNIRIVLDFLKNIENKSPATRFINLGSVKEFSSNSWYATTKKISREIVSFFRESRGLWANQLYLCNVVGPEQDANRFLIPKIIRAARTKKIEKFGNIDAELKILHVENACELIWRAANTKNPEDVVLDGLKVTVKQLIEKIFEKFGILDWESYVEIDEKLARPPDYSAESENFDCAGLILKKFDTIDSIIKKICPN